MRSLLVASLALIPACLIGTGDITGDDQQQQAGTCGDGVVNAGETCDDGNTTNGDGCSSTCQTESSSTPRVMGSVDRPTISTQLHTVETVQLSVTSLNNFAGTVTIAASLVDQGGTGSIPKVTLNAPATVNLTAGATQMVPITLTVAPDASGSALTGTLKLDLTSSAAPESVTASFALDPIFEVDYANGTGATVANHPFVGGDFTVLRGTTIRFKNLDTTTLQHITHGDGGGLDHQEPIAATTALVNTTYDVPTIAIAPGTAGMMGCHTHGSATYMRFTVM